MHSDNLSNVNQDSKMSLRIQKKKKKKKKRSLCDVKEMYFS